MDSSNSPMHLCSSCGKNFDTEAKLKKHFSQVHDMRPRTCKECGEQFNGNLKLSTHQQTPQPLLQFPPKKLGDLKNHYWKDIQFHLFRNNYYFIIYMFSSSHELIY